MNRNDRPIVKKTSSSRQLALWAATLAAVSAAPYVHATSVSVGSSKDNTLFEDPTGGIRNGAGPPFFAGTSFQSPGMARRRGLLAFDLSSVVPAGSTINSVTLTLNLSKTNTLPGHFELHRSLADW